MSSDSNENQTIDFEDLRVVVVTDEAADGAFARITINRDAWRGYTFNLVMTGPAAELSRLEILRDADAAPLTARRLRDIPLPIMERFARSAIDAVAEGSQVALGFSLFTADKWPGKRVREGATRDDLKLAEVARAYVNTLGQSQQSTLLAEQFGYSPSSISKLIRRARERHLLTATSRGRARGSLTPRAIALLEESDAS